MTRQESAPFYRTTRKAGLFPGRIVTEGALEELARREEADSLVLLQHQQAFVAGDDGVRMGSDRRRQHHIVIRVAVDLEERPGVADDRAGSALRMRLPS